MIGAALRKVIMLDNDRLVRVNAAVSVLSVDAAQPVESTQHSAQQANYAIIRDCGICAFWLSAKCPYRGEVRFHCEHWASRLTA